MELVCEDELKDIDLGKRYDPSKNPKQWLAHQVKERYVLYGGAKGGAKTATGVNEGIRLSLLFPGNRGFMGCRDGTDFKRNAFDQLMYFLPPELYAPPFGVHHKTDQYIKLINESIIYYGGLGAESEAEQKINNFPQLGWFFIDQAEQISEKQFLMMDGQLRWNKHVKGMIYKAFLTANPSAGWLRDRFIEKSLPDHIFIPALPKDNPFLPPDYEQKLREIYPPDMVRRLLEGDWDVPGVDQLIPYDWIRQAIERWRYIPEAGATVAGLDVAEFGDNKTVFVVRQGNKVLHIESWVKRDTEFSAGRVAELLRAWKPIALNIDSIGKGGEVCVQLKNDYNVRGVNVSEAASKPERYINKRAEYYGELARRFEMGEIGLPDHAELAANLNSLKKKYRNGKLQIESKDLMRKRGQESPDFSDALMLAFIPSESKREITIYRQGVRVR